MALAATLAACGSAPKKEAEAPRLPPAKPESVEALKDAARLQRLGPANYERALERLKEATDADPRLWEAWYDTGYLLLARHEYDGAIAALEKARAIVATHAPTAQALATAYIEVGRAGDAARVVRELVQKKPQSAEANALRLRLADALRRAGKLDEATETLRQILRLEPRSQAALSLLGMVYEARGQHELAELVLRRALEVDDKSKAAAEVWNNLGLVALGRRRDQEAFAHFDQAARLDPSLTVARRNKAMVYLDCGDYARAVEELRAVTRADPDDVEAWNALGVAERGRGNLEAAERAYSKVIDAEPNSPRAADARFNLVVLFMDFKKDPLRAQKQLDEYLKSAPARHPRRSDAEARAKELAKQAGGGAGSKPGGGL